MVGILVLKITKKFLSLIRGKATDLLLDAFHGGSHDVILP